MQDHLSQTFAALADPTRRAMLARLSKGEANVSDLAKPFLNEMSLPAVTKHLKVLEKAGLITKTREAQWRPASSTATRLKDVADWMEQYRAVLGRELRPPRGLPENRHRQDNATPERKETWPRKNKSQRDPHHPRLRRPRAGRLGRLDRSRAGGAVVGAARLHAHHAQQGSAPRRPLGLHDARPRRHRLPEQDATTTKSRSMPKLVYDHGGNDDRPPLFRVTVLFSEVDGKTKMDMTHDAADARSGRRRPASSSRRPAAIRPGTGWPNTWRRNRPARRQFVINRTFDAPLEMMFEMWTNPEALFAMAARRPASRCSSSRADIRPGGSSVLRHDRRPASRCTAAPSI